MLNRIGNHRYIACSITDKKKSKSCILSLMILYKL